jgi:hypothetical protein
MRFFRRSLDHGCQIATLAQLCRQTSERIARASRNSASRRSNPRLPIRAFRDRAKNHTGVAATRWLFADWKSQFPRFLDDLVQQKLGGLFAATLR